ncbi:MAG: C10 family peptidase [Muribaculaceae bacterium]|nr:C10 family peptidase [Muribaculaceae bacterium]
MKKTLLSILALAAGLLVTDAAEVSVTRAAAIASDVLPGVKFNSPRKARSTKTSEVAVPYYVFNASGNNGFVVVAGDDRLPAVLGYADSGSLDLDNAPDALIALLDMSTAMVDRLSATSTTTSTGDVVVAPLLGDINWGQDTPFNTMCPTLSSGTRGYVGCVATAMTQIMKYYNYPDRGTGSHSYVDAGQTLSADFGNTVYNWNEMPPAVPDAPTDAQIAAYSTLCAHVGISVEMQYAAGGSGAYTMMVPGALTDYFGYSPSLRMHSRSYYNTDEWMSMIRGELDAQRPVYYAATSEDGLGGHAFVCDGYDSEGYVHINWGWYGRSNGFFSINHLNPGELGTGGGSGAYNIQQEILTDFVPARQGDVKTHSVYGATRMSVSYFGTDMMMMTFVENLDTKPFSGSIIAVLTDTDNNILCELKSEDINVDGFKNGHSGTLQYTMRSIPTICTTTVPDGKYRVRFAYRPEGADEAIVLRHPNNLPAYSDCKVMDNQIYGVETASVVPEVKVTSLMSDGDIYANGSARFLAHIDNTSDVFRLSKVCLRLTSVDNAELTCAASTAVNIYDLSEADIEIHLDMPAELPAGDYKVTMYQEGYEDNLFDLENTVVNVKPESTIPVIRLIGTPLLSNMTSGNTVMERDDRLAIALPVKNYGAAGSSMLVCRLTPVDKPDAASYVLGAQSVEWAKGDHGNKSLTAVVRANPGQYRLDINQMIAEGVEVPVEGYDDPATIEIVESPNTALEVTSFNFPDKIAAGERVTCTLSVKALANVSGTLYVRLRRYTYTNGELVYMKSGLNLKAGETADYTFNYRNGLSDGMYVLMVETGSSSVQYTASGHDIYYREVALGDVDPSGVDNITVDAANDAPAIWYDLQGRRVSEPKTPGLYIKKQGNSVSKSLIK